MAILSERHRALFVHIPKTGGQSVRAILHDGHEVGDHHAPAHVLQPLLWAQWRGLFKFAIIRHPVTRLVSLYNHLLTDTTHSFAYLAKDRSFGQFVEAYADTAHRKIETSGFYFFDSQLASVSIGSNVALDYLFKFERLPKELEYLQNTFGRLEHTPHENAGGPYETTVGEKELATIGHLFKEDFDTFKYNLHNFHHG